jgi:hypothetical protein
MQKGVQMRMHDYCISQTTIIMKMTAKMQKSQTKLTMKHEGKDKTRGEKSDDNKV